VAGLRGLESLELRCSVLPEDMLVHVAPLTGLTRLQVECERVSRPGGVGSTFPSAAALTSFPSTLLARLGALSGLTRLADLAVRVHKAVEGDVGALAPGVLIAALPTSLATVRSHLLREVPHAHTPLLAAVWLLLPVLLAVP
jgi:hypothetical protein